MSTKFLSPGWRMPRNANQSKSTNYSLDFDGAATTSINVGNMTAIQGASTFSIAAWINLDSTGAKRIFGSWQSSANWRIAGFGIYNDNKLLLQISGNGNAFDQLFSTSTITTINTWTHVAVTFSSGTAEFYIDGASAGTDTSTTVTSIYDISNDYFIGSFQSSTTLAFDGKMDQVCVFDYVLSPNQITTLWGGGTSASNPMALPRTPIAYYPLGTSAWNGNFLAENNAIGDYVFKTLNTTQSFTSNINQSNTGNKFTVSLWAKNNGVYRFWFDHGATNEGGFQNIGSQLIVYLANNFYQYFTLPSPDLTTDGNWHHYVIYVDSNDVTNSEIWIDKNSLTKASSVSSGSALAFTSGFKLTPRLAEVSNMMYFINYEIDQANVDKLYNYGSPLMSTATLTQAPNAWYKLDASEIYNSSSTEWEINQATANYTSSLSFPGVVGDLLKIPNSSTFIPTSNLTLSFWVNHTTTTSSRDARVFSVPKDSNNEGLYLMDNTNGTLRFTISSSAGNSDTFTAIAVNDGKWHNVVCTWDASGNIKVYTDNGTPSTNTNTGTLTIPASTDMGVGGKFTGTGNIEKFAGLISNGSVWNKALSASEVSEVYNSGQPSNNLSSHSASSNLVAWWKMDNLTTGIQDSSTNSNNGTAFDLSVQPGSVSALNGESLGMSQSNLVQSDLQTVAPYSKYAMKLDDATLSDYINVPNNSTLQITGNLTLSSWVRIDGSYISNGHLIAKADSYVLKSHQSTESNKPRFQVNDGSFHNLEGLEALSLDTWHHIAGVREGNSLKLYVNGDLVASSTPTIGNLSVNTNPVQFNAYTSAYSSDLSLSNNAIWNVALNASEIREIYNEGLPSNLNTFSGTAPISWWQLGENSSFDGSNWKYADEMTAGNDADSVNTAETALTNGVGTTANGTSTGMAVGALVGNAPYSTANAISSGMPVTAKGTDVPPTP